MSVERASGDLGRTLREARERRGVSLRQIADSTKIAVSVLEALERNDISRLPGGIFGRAFVRSFATEVGLDPEAVIQEFIAQFPHDSVTVGHPASVQLDDNQTIESDRRMASTFLRLIALSIPIAAVVVYFTMGGRLGKSSAVGRPAAPVAPRAAPAEALDAPASQPVVAEAGRAAVPAADTRPGAEESARDRLTVTLAVTRPCWVSATVDGRKAIERLLQVDDRPMFDVRRELVLRAGDAAAVQLSINGVAAKSLGKNGEVVTARLNPANFRTFLPAP